MAVAAAGYLTPVAGALFLEEAVDLAVILNAHAHYATDLRNPDRPQSYQTTGNG